MNAWSEGKIGRILAHNSFKTALCMLPNTVWTGDEIDLLVVPPCLRVIDVEIKISRADLRADRHKGRWWQTMKYNEAGPPKPIAYPKHVWKHYYAMPTELWHVDLLDTIFPTSGVLLVSAARSGLWQGWVECVQRATPNKAAKPLDPADVLDIARLATIRMWETYLDLDRVRADNARQLAMYRP